MTKPGTSAKLIGATLLTLAATGCSSTVNGAPEPAGAPTPAATPTGPANPFAALNQCSLVNEILAGQGFPPAQPTIADAKRTCRANIAPSITDTDGIGVAISLQNGQKYTENINHPDTARHGDIDGRPIIEQPEPLRVKGGCQVGMAVGDNARALVMATAGSDTKRACAKAEEVATALSAKLPKN